MNGESIGVIYCIIEVTISKKHVNIDKQQIKSCIQNVVMKIQHVIAEKQHMIIVFLPLNDQFIKAFFKF